MKIAISKTLLLSFFLFISYCSFSQTPIEFNNKLADITDSLFKKGQAWGTKFSQVHASREYSKLAPFRQDMEVFLGNKIKELKTMADVKDSKEFREGMIEFLLFEMKMATDIFKPFEKLDSNSSITDINAVIENLKKAAATENSKLQNYIQLQKEYALNNGFTIAGE